MLQRLITPHPRLRSINRLLWALWLFATPCMAELRQFDLTLQHHLFSPSTLYIPAGEKVRIRLINLDDSPEEFESFALNREKVVLGQSEAVVFIGPVKPGEYAFSGEYNPDTARGMIVALPPEQFAQKQAAITPASSEVKTATPPDPLTSEVSDAD
ncbi:MAG TPA: cupredoxin domain-containing protein [Rheinheimera sp.]|nr:cupredoxin domain-containing protein [Rheinheimera sp.]